MTRRIALVAGTRPELIKLAPLVLEMARRSEFETTFVATAQHRQMLDQSCDALQVRPDIDLDLMQPNQSIADLLSRVTAGVGAAIEQLAPDAVLVQGDTTTCLGAALAAFHRKIPIGHVEAGLRTYNLASPWPEEMNRRLTDPMCQWCFAPTARAAENLRSERIDPGKVFVTGNTSVDAIGMALNQIDLVPPTIDDIPQEVFEARRLIVVTAHRRESFGEPLRNICLALRDVVREHSDVLIVYPVHLNPNVHTTVHEILGRESRVHLVRPLPYLSFISLLRRATLILTDSGGIQEEAPTLRVPVLISRDVTERPEAVELGLARLVGTGRQTIVEEIRRLLTDTFSYDNMRGRFNPYGDGTTSRQIADIMAQPNW